MKRSLMGESVPDKNTVFLLTGCDFVDHSNNKIPIINNGCSIVDDGKYDKCIDLQNGKLYANDSLFDFSNRDFTIEIWAKCKPGFTLLNYSTFLTIGGSSRYPIIYGYVTNNNLGYYIMKPDGNYSIANEFMSNQPVEWTLFALSKQGSKYYSFVNGALISAANGSASLYPSTLLTLNGGWNNQGLNSPLLIDSLKISDIARYTENYTPNKLY